MPPPYQLLKGDPYNISLGALAASILASLKDLPGLPPFLQHQFNAYTNWNLTFIGMRLLLRQEQWDPFLCVNSVSIWLSWKTGFAQGLDDNMRKKFALLGLPLSRPTFVAADHLVHTLPALAFLVHLVRSRRRVAGLNSVYALVLASWFSFRHGAKLDASEIYVRHPWKRAWLALVVGVFTTPHVVDALVDRRGKRLALLLALLTLPWLTTRLDPRLKRKYDFAFALQRVAESHSERRHDRSRGSKPPRVNSVTF